jgi:hypothetical protein
MQRFVDARPFIVYLITKQSGCESDKRILVKALERGCFIVSDGRYLLKPTVSLTYGDHMRKPFHGSLDVCLFTKCLLSRMHWRGFTQFVTGKGQKDSDKKSCPKRATTKHTGRRFEGRR